ncbi:MAG: ribonuclease E activity regulator RraA [Polyangiaceae bacterium]
MAFATADLCDAHGRKARVVEPLFREFGGAPRMSGPISTVRVLEDNVLVRSALEEPGNGRVLVVDGGGSLRTALLGGNLATLAEKNGWAGVVVHGAVRDTVELSAAKVGVRALASCPRKSEKRGEGSRDIPVTFGGITFSPGEMLYADEDGIIVLDASAAG